jgi:hypothetical protein
VARIENQVAVEQLFKTVWADHADLISIQYTGTGSPLIFLVINPIYTAPGPIKAK